MEFLNEHNDIIIVVITILGTIFLAKLKKISFKIGKFIGGYLTPTTRKQAYECIEELKRGIIAESVNGDTNLTTNEQALKHIEKFEIDMGLDPASKEKALK